jgi:hypothetical protein
MCKIREVLRLRFELRLGQQAIARACSISQSTVHEYLNRAAAAGVAARGGVGPAACRAGIVRRADGGKTTPRTSPPDFPALHSQLQQHPHLTLQLAWEEYRQIHPEGYGYSRFLRTLPTLAQEAGCSSSSGTQAWREGLRGLGRRNDSGARSGYWRSPASPVVRDGVGHEFLHLCRSHLGPTVERLDQRSHERGTRRGHDSKRATVCGTSAASGTPSNQGTDHTRGVSSAIVASDAVSV